MKKMLFGLLLISAGAATAQTDTKASNDFLDATLDAKDAKPAAPKPASKPSGVQAASMDTALFKRTILSVMQDAETGFAKTKGPAVDVGGTTVWGANTAITDALNVRVRTVGGKAMYESVLYGNPNDEATHGELLGLSGLVGRALDGGYTLQSGATLLPGNTGAGWQERYNPAPGSKKTARLLLQKSLTSSGAHIITLNILAAK